MHRPAIFLPDIRSGIVEFSRDPDTGVMIALEVR